MLRRLAQVPRSEKNSNILRMRTCLVCREIISLVTWHHYNRLTSGAIFYMGFVFTCWNLQDLGLAPSILITSPLVEETTFDYKQSWFVWEDAEVDKNVALWLLTGIQVLETGYGTMVTGHHKFKHLRTPTASLREKKKTILKIAMHNSEVVWQLTRLSKWLSQYCAQEREVHALTLFFFF